MEQKITYKEFELFLLLNDIKYIRLSFLDMLSQIRFITLPVSRKKEIFNNEISFDGSSITGLKTDIDSDLYLYPDFSSMIILHYLDQQELTVNIFCDLFENENTPYENDSRYILKSCLNGLNDEYGYQFFVGLEIEFYLLNYDNSFIDNSTYFEVGNEKCEKCIHEIISNLERMKIEVRAFHHEVGPSQYEISYNYDSPIKAIEQMVIIKDAIDKISTRYKLKASFAPKIKKGLPGNGLHLNLSILDKENNNLFSNNNIISDFGVNFINGILKYASDINIFANTTDNSYLRLSDGLEAPRYICFGLYNRQAMIRIPKSKPNKKRIEIRNPDHYFSPYIYVYLLIKSGLEGVTNKINIYPELEQKKERDFSSLSLLPLNLISAINYTKSSSFIEKVLSKNYLTIYFKAIESRN